MNDLVCLIHWNQDEAKERAQLVEAAGYRVVRPALRTEETERPVCFRLALSQACNVCYHPR